MSESTRSDDHSPDWNPSTDIPVTPWKRVRCCPGMATSDLHPYPSVPMSRLSQCYPYPCHALLKQLTTSDILISVLQWITVDICITTFQALTQPNALPYLQPNMLSNSQPNVSPNSWPNMLPNSQSNVSPNSWPNMQPNMSPNSWPNMWSNSQPNAYHNSWPNMQPKSQPNVWSNSQPNHWWHMHCQWHSSLHHCSIYIHQCQHCAIDAGPSCYVNTPDVAFPKYTLFLMWPFTYTVDLFSYILLIFPSPTFIPTSMQQR
jgi:hypothetical protein